MGSLEKADLLITCKLGFEKIVASYLKELDERLEVIPAPHGFLGLVLVSGASDKYGLAKLVLEKVPEVEKVYVVEGYSRASPNEIASVVRELVRGKISSNETFAVRTTRRGKHDFTSIDVNVAVGSVVKEVTGAAVDLENPDKVVSVQILQDHAYISIVSGKDQPKKMKPYKYPMYKVFRLFTVAHEPYLGPRDAAYNMGVRIGREVQTYEVGELVVAPVGRVEAEPLMEFLRGLVEGIESRFEVQKRSYGREVHRVKVTVQDMYQFVRDRMGDTLIIFEPEGEPISRVAGEVRSTIMETLKRGKRVYLMVGAREGVPLGLFRYAKHVLDVAPGIVISTEYALASALIAIATILHEALAEAGAEKREETSSPETG
ncbi:MAG: SPOUT family RNA methylase [Desulfurococcaceae archaeon]